MAERPTSATIAREMASLWRKHTRLDEKWIDERDPVKRARLSKAYDRNLARCDRYQRELSRQPSGSIFEALVCLDVAIGKLDYLEEMEAHSDFPKAVEYRLAKRLLWAAVNGIEAGLGVPREKLGLVYTTLGDPFQRGRRCAKAPDGDEALREAMSLAREARP